MAKAWEVEDCYTLVKALELRLGALDYHVAMLGGMKPKRAELEIVVYPDVKDKDVEHVRSLLHATEMQLRSIEELKKPRLFGKCELRKVSAYEYGRGKNTRRVLVFLQQP